MSTAAEQLQQLNAIHDDAPQDCAAGLLALDAGALDAEQQRSYAFLLNHVLGEKLGRWTEAVLRLAPLAAAADAPLAVLRQHAVALRCAGDTAQAARAIDALARRAEADPALARALVDVAALNFQQLTVAQAPTLAAAATLACAHEPGALDESLAASFNNTTTALYYATRVAPASAELRSALRRGAETALLFWLRAGGWLQHERAHYLRAKIALRTGEPVAAVAHAERGLAIVAANGDDPVERAFLLQLLAAGAERCGHRRRAAELRAAIDALAPALDDDTRQLLAHDAAEFPSPPATRLAFVGGGNMANALIGGLVRAGTLGAVHVIELDAARRAELERAFGVTTAAAPDAALAGRDVIVLAVKPQQMREVCATLAPHVGSALVLSIAAGIRAADIARWLGTERVVRAMPNTPALIGQGISGVAALPAVSEAQRALAAQVLAGAGPVVWVEHEALLDAVTAVSGSGPAYVFHFIEALQAAGSELGLSDAQARQLAIATFAGASQLAAQSTEPVSVLRERVTSKGGTTAAALAQMASDQLARKIGAAVAAAGARARELGDEFGRD